MNTENNLFQTRVIQNAAYYRERARNMLRGIYWIAFAASFIATLFGATVTGSGLVFTGALSSTDDISFFVNGVGRALQDGEWIRRIVDHSGALMAMAVSGLGVFAVSVFLTAPLRMGYVKLNLDLFDGKHPNSNTVVSVLFSFFKNGLYWKSVGLHLLHGLLILAASLPSLILGGAAMLFTIAMSVNAPIVAGATGYALMLGLWALTLAASFLPIMVQYRYYFAFHILADYPEMSPVDALQASAELMNGKKWKLFCLHFSFIGWIVLVALTGGIGELFLTPYTAAADAVFYGVNAQRGASSDVEFPSVDPDDYDPDLAQW